MATYFPSIRRRGDPFVGSGALLATAVLVVLAATVDLPALPILAPLGLAVRDDGSDAARRLTDAVDSLADGEYAVDLPTDRDDELGRLAERVEALADDLRERERRAEQRRAFTADILDAVDDVFYVLDRDGTLRRWNERLEQVTGYEEQEVAEMHALDFFVEADRAAVGDAIERVFETGDARVEARFRTKGGDEIPYEFAAASLEDPDGDLVLTGIGRDITERTRYERDVERTAHLLEQSQRLANVGAWEVDVSGDDPDVWVSDEVARIHGLDPGAGVDLEAAIDFYHPDDRPAIREALARAIEAGDGYDLELRLRPADGGRRWVRTIGEPVAATEEGIGPADGRPADGGEIVTVRGSMQDITDRKRRERDLERTTERLDTVVSNVPVVLFAFDADGTITLSEGRGLGTLEYEPGELVGESIFDLYEDHDAILRDVERTLAGETVRASREVDGVVLETTYQPVFDGGEPGPVGKQSTANGRTGPGEVSEVIAVSMDVTARRERERELERYETIVQAVGDPVYALDADGNFRFVNDAVETLAGWDPDDLVGEPVTTVMLESDFETGRENIRALRRGDESFRTFEMGLETVDGDVIRTENSMALLSPGTDAFAGIAGVVRDISDRVERERELERTRDLLQRVQRMADIGGWELDLRADPSDITWTEELYRLHDLSEDASLDLETILARYHPDDRPRVRRELDRALETGAGYDLEGRLVTDEGTERWVRAMGEPIRRGDPAEPEPDGRTGADAGDLVAYRGAVQDVTDRKERELALESLHETALDLLNVDSAPSVAERVVEAADEVLDADGASLYALDDETNELDPLAYTAGFVDHCGPPRAVPVGSDSPLWDAFATGVRTVIDDATTLERSPAFGDAVAQALVVPVGDHGVFTAVATETSIEEGSRRLAETLAATAAAAFDRLESEAHLRDRDAALEERNRRLRRQMRVIDIIRSIDRSLIRADSRAAIERTVCQELVEAEGIAFAWIGARDGAGSELDPRAWAGDDGSYLDAVSLDTDAAAEPAVTAATRGETVVVSNVVDRLAHESWRRTALGRGFQSVVAVPLAYEDYTYGVLSVYADDPDAFADLERSVFAELGDGIANAINAVQTRAALHAETRTEVTLEIADGDELLSRLARASGCRVEYEGLGAFSDDGAVLFVTTAGGDPEAVESALEDLVAVADYRLVSRGDETCRFEVTASADTLPGRLVRHGATPRSIASTGAETSVVADLPRTTDVRAFVEMLRDAYDSVELRGRRNVERETGGSRPTDASLLEALTPRQVEVLRTAYFAGFFEWPRESTGQEVAEMLSVSQPTVNRHLRLGQGRLLAQLFEDARRVEPAPE